MPQSAPRVPVYLRSHDSRTFYMPDTQAWQKNLFAMPVSLSSTLAQRTRAQMNHYATFTLMSHLTV
jgi:hypothetical protein